MHTTRVKRITLTDDSIAFDVQIHVDMEGQSDVITIACTDENQAETVEALLDQTTDISVERV